jgi:thiol-disulfide isomerase/thioredoxin
MGKQTFMIAVGFILVAGLAVFVIFYHRPTDPGSAEMPVSTVPIESSESPSQDDIAQQASNGQYLDYSSEAFTAHSDTQRILFFHAPWCSQCRSIEADILNNEVPDGVTIYKVDFDSATDLRATYDVTLQTTFVAVDQDGTFVRRFVAAQEPNLAAVLRELVD